jgi:O-methyltransferase
VFTDLDAVRAYVEPFGVELIAGDIAETHRALEGEPLLLAFFDTDNYTPARAALELCARQLVVGGSIVFDHVATTADYVDTLGERVAAYEVLEPAAFLHLHGTGVFTKLA